MREIVNLYNESTVGSPEAAKYEQMLWDFVSVTKAHQNAPGCQPKVANCQAEGGPGEPKYNPDGSFVIILTSSLYTLPWGRLQNDGPGLRASTLVRFADIYLSKGGDVNKVKQLLYDGKYPSSSVIKVDLEYVANNWRQLNFDLWEGMHLANPCRGPRNSFLHAHCSTTRTT